jgi:hypothetical protein
MAAQWPGTGEGVVHVMMGSVVTASCKWMAPSMWDAHLRRKDGGVECDGEDEMVGFLQVKFKPGAEPKPPRLANPRMAAADF